MAGPDSCLTGVEGDAVQTFTFSGAKTITNKVAIVGDPPPFFLTGALDGDRLSGRYTYLPTDGTCLTPNKGGDISLDAVLYG